VAEVLRREDLLPPVDRLRYQAWLLDLTEQLIEEIDQQRKLLAAERGEFVCEVAAFGVAHLLEQVRHTYVNHGVAEGRSLRVEPVGDLIAVSDPTIVRRILGNLVKNALEAVDIGQEVVVSVTHSATEITFQIANPGVIPDDIQRQLFTRTFSSKAAIGRGIGTYSAKLFTERYLDGRIGFTSSAPAGTCFWITLPQTCPA
jgi:signal transduction histidine kinase